MKPKNQIIYDWISFTSKIHSVNDILNILDFRPDTVRFQSNDYGRYFYTKSLYYDGIHIYYDGYSKEYGNMCVCVEMSGKGLRNWEEYSNADYDKLFSLILSHYDPVEPDNCGMKLTRLDVAYDDFEGILDLKQIMRDAQDYNYLSRLRNCTVNLDMSEGDITGLTVAHGSMKSNVYIRMYDKRLEQKTKLLDHWIRVELQLRKENANGFIMLNDTIEHKYFSVLNQYLRYLVPSEDSHRERWSTAPYWLNFVRSAESASIFHKPKNDYKPENLINYVENQLSGAVSTYIEIVGVDNFLVNLHNARSGKSLNPKYKAIKDKADSNGQQLLDYLKEHDLL